MDDAILEDEIISRIPPELKSFIHVYALPLPRSMESIVTAFWAAVESIEPGLRFPCRVHVTFATSPFAMAMPNGELGFETKPEVINAVAENLAFLDCNKMSKYRWEIQVACILEELVHIMMNIKDEDLVKHVVAFLFPGVVYTDGKYRVAPSLVSAVPPEG